MQLVARPGDPPGAVVGVEGGAHALHHRGFRHVVRNVHAYVLDPRLVAVLIDDLPETGERVHVQLAAFADALQAIAEAAGA